MADEVDEPGELASPGSATDEMPSLDDEDPSDRLASRKGWLLRLTKQLGGAVTAIAVEGRYAYVGKGYRLLVLDLADPVHPVIAGASPTLDQMVQQVLVEGTLAVVSTFESVYLFDVSTPSAPVQRSRIPVSLESGHILLRFPDLIVDGYVREEDHAVSTFDVSDAGHPRRISVQPRPSRPLEWADEDEVTVEPDADGADPSAAGVAAFPRCQRAGDAMENWLFSNSMIGSYAYVVAADGLHVLDCADPTHPRECYSFLTGEAANQVLVSGQTACVVCYLAGVYTFDARDPAAPVPLAHLGYPHDIETAALGDGVLYLATSGRQASHGTAGTRYGIHERGLVAVDVRDPHHPVAHPVDLGLYHAHLAATSGDRAYVIDGDDAFAGLRCLDLARECDLGERSWIAVEERAEALAADGPLTFAAMGHRLVVFDFADPERPKKRGDYLIYPLVPRIVTQGHAIYLAANDELHLVSVRNPDRPRALVRLKLPAPVLDFAAVGGVVAVLAEDGLHVVLCERRTLRLAGHWASAREYDSVALVGTRALLVHDHGVTVVETADPMYPRQVGTAHTWRRRKGGEDIVAGRGFAFCRDWDDIYALDLTNPRRPTLAGDYHTWDHGELIPNGLAAHGKRCFVAAQESGLLVLELGSEGSEAAIEAQGKMAQ